MNQFEHPKMLQLTELEWRWSLNPKKKKNYLETTKVRLVPKMPTV